MAPAVDDESLLKEYLVDKTAIPSLLPESKFLTLARTHGISPADARTLYKSLKSESTSTGATVTDNIHSFCSQLAIADSATVPANSSSTELAEVNATLAALNAELPRLKHQLDKLCARELQQLSARIDDLTDLKYGNPHAHPAISEALNELKALQQAYLTH